MHIQYLIFILSLTFLSTYSVLEFSEFTNFSNVFFIGDSIKQEIMTNPFVSRQKQCEKLLAHMVEKKFVCVYVYPNDPTISSGNKMFFNLIKSTSEILFDENSIRNFTNRNKKEIDFVNKQYMSFYISTLIPLHTIGKNAVKYFFDKTPMLYNLISDTVKGKYKLDKENEEIIFHDFESKIKYFTNDTVNRYATYYEFLNALESSMCFTTDLNTIIKSQNDFYKQIENLF